MLVVLVVQCLIILVVLVIMVELLVLVLFYLQLSVAVEVAFDGTDPEITVGTAGDPDLLHEVVENDLEDSQDYQTVSQFVSGSDLDIRVFLSGTGIAVGRARVTAFFAEGE